MTSAAIGKPDVLKREITILNLLRQTPEGATAREIYDVVTAALGDTISRPAYYKILDRLVTVGKVDAMDYQGVRRYVIAPQIHAGNRLTLDDVYDMLPFVESSESMARAIEAQQYFVEHRNTVLRQAAQALAEEPAADLFCLWIRHLFAKLQADLESYHLVEHEGPHIGVRVLADSSLERRLQSQCILLRDLLYRLLSVPRAVAEVPDWEGPHGLKREPHVWLDEVGLIDVLKHRVFGVGERETVLGLTTIDGLTLASAAQEMLISGSDGSFHAGTVGLRTAHGYIEDDSFVVTFNNSVAYIRSSDRLKLLRGDKMLVHSAPLTRQTLDDPAYKGMVLAPFMFPQLTEAQYEHMTLAASDVVQLRVDDEVFGGTARDIATGEPIPAPRVHFRDGTITPQERGFHQYYSMNPYGEITREGIARIRRILQRIASARGAPQVFAGAVKSTSIQLFSRLINWYIAEGSRLTRHQAIEPNWDSSRASFISDIDAMTMLLANLEPPPHRNGFWTSCVVVRQFPSLTDFYDTSLAPGQSWFDVLREQREYALQAYEKYRGELPYHAIISEDDLQEDSYLYLLEHADYASFYVGHTAGEPPPKIPRYEFLCSLRGYVDDAAAREQVERAKRQLVTALLTCDFTPDRDHNFLQRLSLVRLLPSVVHRAHEFAKHLGGKLETEYKSIVVKRLAERRKRRVEESDIEIQPVGLVEYLRRLRAGEQDRPALPDQGGDR